VLGVFGWWGYPNGNFLLVCKKSGTIDARAI